MKKLLLVVSVTILFLSSCEVEYLGDARHHHYRGYEHSHYPNHREVYHHGYHHDIHGDEIIIQPRH
jgi:hypothetical protein